MSKQPDETQGEVVVFDFNGTDPQSDRSINFALSHEMLKMFIARYLLTVFVGSRVLHRHTCGRANGLLVIGPCDSLQRWILRFNQDYYTARHAPQSYQTCCTFLSYTSFGTPL